MQSKVVTAQNNSEENKNKCVNKYSPHFITNKRKRERERRALIKKLLTDIESSAKRGSHCIELHSIAHCTQADARLVELYICTTAKRRVDMRMEDPVVLRSPFPSTSVVFPSFSLDPEIILQPSEWCWCWLVTVDFQIACCCSYLRSIFYMVEPV
jgi:hypothetical protein